MEIFVTIALVVLGFVILLAGLGILLPPNERPKRTANSGAVGGAVTGADCGGATGGGDGGGAC